MPSGSCLRVVVFEDGQNHVRLKTMVKSKRGQSSWRGVTGARRHQDDLQPISMIEVTGGRIMEKVVVELHQAWPSIAQ